MRLKVIFGVIVAAALVVGCGSSDSSSSSGTANSSSVSTDGTTATSASKGDGSKSSGKPLSKAEFIKQGDEICGKVPNAFTEKVKELEEEPGKNQPKLSKAEVTEEAGIPPLYVAIEELEELTPPKGDEQTAEEMIAALEDAAKGLEKTPSAPFSGPQSPFDEFQKLTKKYGFKFCSGL